MILVVVLTLLLGVDCSQAQHKYNALTFAGGPDDKIQWYPDMSPFATQMSLCTWINRRFLDSYSRPYANPVVLSYRPESQSINYIKVTPTEDSNFIISSLYLSGKYKAPIDKWYHICYTWGDYVLKSYFNGQEVASKRTARRQIITGGKMSVGNRADAHRATLDAFEGELFKLNIFNRVLNSTEIREMASDMCSSYEEEEILNLNRSLKWEDIMLQQWIRGNVTEIPTDCSVVPEPDTKERLRRIEERLNIAEQELKETKTSLNNTQEELTETKTSLNNTQEELTETKTSLNNTQEELTETKTSLNSTQEELTETKTSLNDTQKELTETMRILKCHKDTFYRHFRYRLTRNFHFHFSYRLTRDFHFRYRLTRNFHFHFRYRLTRNFQFHFRYRLTRNVHFHFRYRLTRNFHFHFRYRLTRDFHFHFRYRLTRNFHFHFRYRLTREFHPTFDTG